jgi:flavin reductase (DIM6/NTAB) family NADH-FMN oxidoreductase RutF
MDWSGPASLDGATIDPDTQRAFEQLVAPLDYPMVIVTAASEDGRRAGCLVGFWTQCGIDPARVLVCLSKRNHTFRVANDAPVLAVHWLSPEERGLAELFGGETGDDTDFFARCSWAPGPGGVPVLDAPKGWVAGPVLGRLDAGDHVAFLVEPRAGACRDGSAGQLGFQAVKNLEPGHEP